MAVEYSVDRGVVTIRLTLTRREARAFSDFLQNTAPWDEQGGWLNPDDADSANERMAELIDTIDDAFVEAGEE